MKQVVNSRAVSFPVHSFFSFSHFLSFSLTLSCSFNDGKDHVITFTDNYQRQTPCNKIAGAAGRLPVWTHRHVSRSNSAIQPPHTTLQQAVWTTGYSSCYGNVCYKHNLFYWFVVSANRNNLVLNLFTIMIHALSLPVLVFVVLFSLL